MPRPDRQTCSVATALDLVLALIAPTAPGLLPLSAAAGCVTAERLLASADLPSVPIAAMDGFAVRVSDLAGAAPAHPITLSVAGNIAAGQPNTNELNPQSCIRIMTGATCPVGTDAIVPWEKVQESAGEITFRAPVVSGQHIRYPGELQQQGTEIVAAGTLLTAGHLGLIAGDGVDSILVHPRPQVALITMGDELTEPGHAQGHGTIPDSNSISMPALLHHFGAEIVARLRVVDSIERLTRAVQGLAGLSPDLIVTVGGASSSERDVLGRIYSPGFDLRSLDVNMRPGRPLVCGMAHGIPLVGLPGNPGAATISAWQFVRPAIRKLAGMVDQTLPLLRLPSLDLLPNEMGRRTFVRARLQIVDGVVCVGSAGSQAPANQVSLAAMDALIVLDEKTRSVAVGDLVPVQILDPDRLMALLAMSPPNT
ncbi:MAG TPA: molybdopterin molybdotransferase MoeA [Thermomicrobiales bacterium]|nr:molybdopterin molybdotransferase MoeA [Thermomicrobiales bacterium]